MRVAVVTDTFGDDAGREAQLIARRISGALSCRESVFILAPDGLGREEEVRGAFTIRHFPSTQAKPSARENLLNACLGSSEPLDLLCSCADQATVEFIEALPKAVQEELVALEGGHSPELYSHLRTEKFDVVVFADYRKPFTYFGVREAADYSRIVLLPLAREEPSFFLPIYDSIFSRADRVITVTETEQNLILRRVGKKESGRVINVGFALQVNRLAAKTEPANYRNKVYVVAASDSLTPQELEYLRRLGSLISREFNKVCLSVVGRNAQNLASSPWIETHQMISRADLWRWSNRAVALLDHKSHQLLARDSLEAMLCGTPVVVSDVGGAAREHAELGNGGLWFRNNSELCACIETLLSGSVRDQLGAQGREYAQSLYGDPDRFIQRVTEAVLG